MYMKDKLNWKLEDKQTKLENIYNINKTLEDNTQ